MIKTKKEFKIHIPQNFDAKKLIGILKIFAHHKKFLMVGLSKQTLIVILNLLI